MIFGHLETSLHLADSFGLLGWCTGPEAARGDPRLREREVAHHCEQGRDGVHARGLPRAGFRVDGAALIAINVPAGRVSSRVRGHDISAAAPLMKRELAFDSGVSSRGRPSSPPVTRARRAFYL